MHSVIIAPIERMGRRIITEIQWTREIFGLLYLTIKQFWSTFWDQLQGRQKGIRAIGRVVVMQIYFTGVQALGILSLLGIIIGSVVVLQSVTQLSKFGGIEQIGELIVLTIIRDVGPLLTILIVIARSGTAIASEVATMKVNHEIDALQAMGISTLEYIVIPRVIGGILSVLAATIWFSAVGILGGYVLAALLLNLPWVFYIDKVLYALTLGDIAMFLIKSIVGGGAVFLIACLQGLSAGIASYEVPIVTIGCVVKSLFFCFFFHAVVTSIYYLFSHNGFLTAVTGVF